MIKVIDIDYLRVSNNALDLSVVVLKDGRQLACGKAANYAEAVTAVNSRFNKA